MSRNFTVPDHSHTCRGNLPFLSIWRYEPPAAHVSFLLYHLKTHTLVGTFCLSCRIWRHLLGHHALKLYLKPQTHRLVATLYLWYCILSRHTRLSSKEPPPPAGGFLFIMFHDQKPRGRGPPLKHLVQILRGRSSSSGFSIREHSK